MQQNLYAASQNTPVTSIEHALSLQQAGKFEDAKKQYKKILKRNPKDADALHFIGVLAFQAGKQSAALDYLNKALKIAPRYAEALNSRALIHEKTSKWKIALEDYNSALSINPALIDALYNRGSLFLNRQKFKLARDDFDNLLSKQPDHLNARLHRGLALKSMGDFSAALIDFDYVISKKPNTYSALNNRGNLLSGMSKNQEALEDLNCAIKLKPRSEDAYISRGNLLQKLGNPEDAIKDFNKALEINPKSMKALNNRGFANLELSRIDHALADFQSALEIAPEISETWSNIGTLYKDINLSQKALEAYDNAIALDAENAEAQFGKSLILLRKGDFKEGWRLYEWRKHPNRKKPATSSIRQYAQPLWLGRESLAGKTLFIYWEQGLGDTIQFSRLAKRVSNLGCKVILEVQEPLTELMKNIAGVDELIQDGQAIPAFDFHCPLMSLPYALGLQFDDIKTEVRYLDVDKTRLNKWRRKIDPKCGLRVGIAWSGNKSHSNDRNRSIRLANIDKSLRAVSELFSIQKEIRPEDADYLALSQRLHHFGDELNNFADTAALVELMDVVVSVDTSVAHLAGALGKKVFLLLPYAPDFRWLEGIDKTPWYPKMTLFRQGSDRDWSRVFADVDDAIANLIN